MFQNLANYLLGSVTGSANQQEQQQSTAEGVEGSSIQLTAVENDDDDWVLVDRGRDSEGNSDDDSLASIDELDDRALPLPLALTRTSSASSIQHVANMEESWFITPPPCFTSAGPVHMETSPLENLLIEHPSMSVYQHTHRRYSLLVPLRPATPSQVEEEEETLVVEEVEHEAGTPIAVVRRVNRLHALQQQETQKIMYRQAQKVQKKKVQQATSRNYMDRNNKAREVNGRNMRQRRKERSQGASRSHANNNRKCC